MGAQEATKFPIVGSMTLFGLYLAIKKFGKEVVNVLLLLYFLIGGVDSVKELIDTYASKSIKASIEKAEK